MVETQVKFIVVGHHSRHKQALRLAESLSAFLLIDNSYRGANWNYHRALQWAAEQSSKVVVLKDDAQPVRGIIDQVADWVKPLYLTDHDISVMDRQAKKTFWLIIGLGW